MDHSERIRDRLLRGERTGTVRGTIRTDEDAPPGEASEKAKERLHDGMAGNELPPPDNKD
jgi:hypothetical protein